MFNTRLEGLHIVDDMGEHVLAAVIGAVYESVDGAKSWKMIVNSSKLGTCNTFKNGTINGMPHVIAGCSVGLANWPTPTTPNTKLGPFMVIPPGNMARGYFTLADADKDGKLLENSVVGICQGHPWHGRIINRTYANWTVVTAMACTMMALNPNNADQFMITHPPWTGMTFDVGKTWESLNHSNIYHCGIDRQGWLYTAAMGGAFRSTDQGHSWKPYVVIRHQRRTNRTVARVPHDYQRLKLDFAGGVAFPPTKASLSNRRATRPH